MVTAMNAAMDYSENMFFGALQLFTKKPEPLDPFLKVLQPLEPTVWYGFGITTLLFAALFAIMTWINFGFKGKPGKVRIPF